MAVNEISTVSLEWYLDNADPKVLKDHRHLSFLLEHIDPRLMLNDPLDRRMMPLDSDDIKDIAKLALIKPVRKIDSLIFNDQHLLLEYPALWETFGDPIRQLDIYQLNLALTAFQPEGWNLVLMKRTPDIQAGDNTPYLLGWINIQEIDLLKQYISESDDKLKNRDLRPLVAKYLNQSYH